LTPLAGGLQRCHLSVERLPVRAYPRRAKIFMPEMRLAFANSFCITQPFENARARLLRKSLDFCTLLIVVAWRVPCDVAEKARDIPDGAAWQIQWIETRLPV